MKLKYSGITLYVDGVMPAADFNEQDMRTYWPSQAFFSAYCMDINLFHTPGNADKIRDGLLAVSASSDLMGIAIKNWIISYGTEFSNAADAIADHYKPLLAHRLSHLDLLALKAFNAARAKGLHQDDFRDLADRSRLLGMSERQFAVLDKLMRLSY